MARSFVVALFCLAVESCSDSGGSGPAVNAVGTLSVTSTPAGAAIVVNHQATSKTTPHSFTNQDTGSYTVRVILSGYYEDSSVVQVTPNAESTVHFTLVPLAAPVGKLFVASSPAGASIYLEGNNTGKVTPDTLKNLLPGDHTVKLALSGYYDSTFTVMIVENQTTVSMTALRKIAHGHVFISSTPAGAAIVLDSMATGKVTPDTLKNLLTGIHTVKLTLAGYYDSTFAILIEEDLTTVSQTALQKLPSGDALVTSTPSGAAIVLDNTATGKVTPDTLKNLGLGSHSVKLTLSGYYDSTFTINIAQDQLTISATSLRRIPAGDIFISSTPVGATITLDNVLTGKITPDTLKNVMAGNHTVKLKHAGYLDSSFSVTVLDSQLIGASIVLRAIPKVPQNIQDIFNNHCIGCHSGSNPPQGQNLSEDSAFVHIVNKTSNENPALKRILPFDADNSYLVRKIQGTGITGERMPFGGPYLTQTQIDSVRSWVLVGARPR